ncbi:MAG: hypothetical protein WC750_03435 [Patescibacteria group bacterium]|jgi:NADP-dependent 3-hydroxy acid dehydrogenase YdfG
MKRIVIVSGANGSLGEKYLKYFAKKSAFYCVGLSRTNPKHPIKKVKYILSNLLDAKKLESEMNQIDFEKFSEIILIHPVGKFKFEGKKITRIGKDKQIYDSNVTTFINLANILSKRITKNKKIVFCCFGSVSDKFNVPYWTTYTKSKLRLKEILKTLSKHKNIRSVFINVSSVATGNEEKLRPFADKAHWLKPEKIVSKSAPEILLGKLQFVELDIIEPNPSFKDNYYLDHAAIYEKWKREMGK